MSYIIDHWTEFVANLEHEIGGIKEAHNIPPGDSSETDDDDYLAEVGRMLLERLNETHEI